MAPGRKKKGKKCCSFEFPDIPAPYLLFIEFAFTFGTTIVYFADIVTDTITLVFYWENGWHYAFALSLGFIILPSILLAVLEFNFLRKTHGKSFKWPIILLRTALNIPFQLTVIWYHLRLSYTFLCNWLDNIRGHRNKKTTAQWYSPTTLERSRGASLSSLNELDFYRRNAADEDSNIHGSEVVHPPLNANLSLSMGSLTAIDNDGPDKKDKDNWWQRLTREQWLSHLNKLKLSESMLESLPQLLINLYLIATYKETSVIQYISAVLSYLSLCGGVVRYDKTRKDNEADQWMVDRTLIHSRAFHTRLEWPQILFITLYKGSFLAARILAFVFFTLFFSWFVLIPILLHWGIILCYFVYRWYPDFNKVSKQLQQADYKYRAYIFLSHDFMSVFHASLMAIFIHVRPYYHAYIDQPYCFMFWYYMVYVTENLVLFLLPGIIYSLQDLDAYLNSYQYYALMATDLLLNAAGCIFCVIYYLAVHKMRAFTAHAYPSASRILCGCCKPDEAGIEDEGYWLPIDPGWTVCKQAETSEIFFLTKEQLKSFHQTYNTVVRKDRLQGRAVECFIDDRCKIFYAPRSKMKKMKIKGYVGEHTLPRPSLRRLNDSAKSRTTTVIHEEDPELCLEQEERPRSATSPQPQNASSPAETLPKTLEDVSDPQEAEDQVDTPLLPPSPPAEEPIARPVPKARSSSSFKSSNRIEHMEIEVAPGAQPRRIPRKHESQRRANPPETPINPLPRMQEDSYPALSEVKSVDEQRKSSSQRKKEATRKSGQVRRDEDPYERPTSRRSQQQSDHESDRMSSASRAKDARQSSSSKTRVPPTAKRRSESGSRSKNCSSTNYEPKRERRETHPYTHEQDRKRSSSRSKTSSKAPPGRDDGEESWPSVQLDGEKRRSPVGMEDPGPEQPQDITNELPGWQQTWI